VNRVTMLLHGMGPADDWADQACENIQAIHSGLVLPLSYHHEVQATPLTVVGSPEVDAAGAENEYAADAYNRGLEQGFFEGYIAARFELSDDQLLAPEGEYADEAGKIVFNVYSYVYRYLRRQTLYTTAFDAVHRQLREYIQAYELEPGSALLVGHSLGSVVALDLLHMPEARYFKRLITLGSPLGLIAQIPVVHRTLLPFELREVPVEWVDVMTSGDPFARVRVTTSLHFSGQPLRPLLTISGKYTKAHNAYFSQEEAIRQWTAYVD
jgi:hypothetical protein